MGRCRSWRPNADRPADHRGHLPGSCRACWSPCRLRVESGQRCSECWYALAQHDDDTVRRAVLDEPDVPVEVLELLATDHSSTIANAATALLATADGERTAAPVHEHADARFGEHPLRHPQDPPTERSWLDDVLPDLPGPPDDDPASEQGPL